MEKNGAGAVDNDHYSEEMEEGDRASSVFDAGLDVGVLKSQRSDT